MCVYGVLGVEASFMQSVNDSSHFAGIQVKASVRKTLQKSPSESPMNTDFRLLGLVSVKHLFCGHSQEFACSYSIRMTVDVYGHLVPGANRAAMDRLPTVADAIEDPEAVEG